VGGLECGHRGGRDRLDTVELPALERCDLRVVGLEELQAQAVDMQLRPVEAGVPLEQGDLFRRVLLQDERAAGDDRSGLVKVVRALLLPAAYFAQMGSGKIGTAWTCERTFATGRL
jgi:hypothetical protein